ncbi:TRAP transporter small permease [Halomonas rhizosphaerae]|uniref:TRAP transporter small permease protein n=1 Tax=Halomonas rhizosphaerae TaxID=3043296 RepID=A0ABT6UZA5_9GAMM|nr:TRAP transporter small permease subunit [Halomonas rhizosphaerae]MDI5890344.1 TRAP transporter small permease subunit [Halomonas rhizosphaerae]
MAAIFQSFQRLVAGVFAAGAGLSMALIFLIVFLNALGRYTLGRSLAWGDQVPVFLGIYGVMFGMALAYLQDRHVRLGVIVDFLSVRLREALFLIVDLAVVVIGAVLAWSGYLFMSSRGGMRISGLNSTIRSLREATGLEVFNVFGTMAPYQFAIVLGGGMLAVAATLKFIERLGALRAMTDEVS